MEELKIDTNNGFIPLDEELIKKYGLKKGTKTPFTGYKIVGKDGDYTPQAVNEKSVLKPDEKTDDGIVEIQGGAMLTTSEILDFAQGADSTTDRKKS